MKFMTMTNWLKLMMILVNDRFFEVYDVEIYNLIRQKRCSYDNRRN